MNLQIIVQPNFPLDEQLHILETWYSWILGHLKLFKVTCPTFPLCKIFGRLSAHQQAAAASFNPFVRCRGRHAL